MFTLVQILDVFDISSETLALFQQDFIFSSLGSPIRNCPYMETRDGKKYLEYCKIRNKIRALTGKLRKELERNVANQAKRNPKAFWKY